MQEFLVFVVGGGEGGGAGEVLRPFFASSIFCPPKAAVCVMTFCWVLLHLWCVEVCFEGIG